MHCFCDNSHLLKEKFTDPQHTATLMVLKQLPPEEIYTPLLLPQMKGTKENLKH